MNNALIAILSIIGVGVIYWILFGEKRVKNRLKS